MSTRGRDKRLNVPYFEVQVSWQSQHLVDFDVQIPPAHYPPPTFSESEFSQRSIHIDPTGLETQLCVVRLLVCQVTSAAARGGKTGFRPVEYSCKAFATMIFGWLQKIEYTLQQIITWTLKTTGW